MPFNPPEAAFTLLAQRAVLPRSRPHPSKKTSFIDRSFRPHIEFIDSLAILQE
jgi:hypothetical protein